MLPGGHPLHGAGAGRARPQGRVRQALRGAARRGLHAREGRRRAAPARGGDRARQEVQARHRGRGRPARDAARPAQAARRLDRDRGRRWPRASSTSRTSRPARSPPTRERFACLHCGTSMPELEPRMFSFNSPHGACPRCTGLGSQMEIDPELIVPDPSLSLNEGAILPWSTSASNYYDQMTQAIAERYEIDLDTPWEDLDRGRARTASCTARTATGSTSRTATATAGGARTRRPSRASSPTSSGATRRPTRTTSREKIEEYMSVRPVPGLRRRAAAAGVARGEGRRARHPRGHADVGAARDRVVRASSS